MPIDHNSQHGPRGRRVRRPVFSGFAEIKPMRTLAQVSRVLGALPNLERKRQDGIGLESFKLDRMRALLDAMGNPHHGLSMVHVAGSKGKGSTVEMLSACLGGCGYGVGVYTSPHLVDVRERIRIGMQPIEEADFVQLFNRVVQAGQRIEAEFGSPSYFEVLTAMALAHFAAQAVDVAVIEVGLGGRLDSTNVISPILTCITHIQLEHTHILGDTLQQVAREKAGIFKPGVPAITVDQDPAVLETLREVAETVGCPLVVLGDEVGFNERFEADGEHGPHIRVGLMSHRGDYEHMAVPIPGKHQASNCGLALAALDQLREFGFDVPEVRVAEGLAHTARHGRVEQVWPAPRTIIDGAHTPESVEALVRAIGAHIRYDSMVVVFGCSQDKEIDGMLCEIARGADKIIFTTSSDNPRAADPESLKGRYTELTGKMAQVEPDVRAAINTAARAVGKGDLICITGSFYVAGEAKRLFLEKKQVSNA
ncbi:MAG TPA: bifunctional folylpolyglutamate synthase/dihydrofolate synthase [Phycisphaerales bacterium]|nr:bifunctional folylpolyglutamate synthase/dihydrofolate synthase [Phycisphaerales bacterium]